MNGLKCSSRIIYFTFQKELRTVFDKPVFVHSLNLLSRNKDPIWDDGFAVSFFRSAIKLQCNLPIFIYIYLLLILIFSAFDNLNH